jgi:hypothetical protein
MPFDITRVGRVLDSIKTPLTLAGLALLVFYGVTSNILALKIFPTLAQSNSAALLTHLLDYTFILAVVSIVLGVASFLVTQWLGRRRG